MQLMSKKIKAQEDREIKTKSLKLKTLENNLLKNKVTTPKILDEITIEVTETTIGTVESHRIGTVESHRIGTKRVKTRIIENTQNKSKLIRGFY